MMPMESAVWERPFEAYWRTAVAENLAQIMETVKACPAEAILAWNSIPTLVRGMCYYTGTIFEVAMEGFGGSVAGGGRYDKMIGKIYRHGYTGLRLFHRL